MVLELLKEANQHKKAGNLPGAERCCVKALVIDAGNWMTLLFMGMLKAEQGCYDEAISYYLRVMEVKPECAEAYNSMGLAMQKKGRLTAAIECFQQAIDFKRDFFEAYINCGNVLLLLEIAEAKLYLEKAIQLCPQQAVGYFNFGNMLFKQEQYDQALDYFDQALAINGQYAEAHWGRAMILLRYGHYREGFREFEWRRYLSTEREYFSWFERWPAWEGQPLYNKRLLVYAEQGFGDSIQMIRYLPLLKDLGATVVLSCQQPLMRLFCVAAGVDQIVEHSHGILETIQADFAVPIMSLPYLLGSAGNNIPRKVPYLNVEIPLVSKWREKIIPNCFNIGLVWAGSPTHSGDKNRSVNLEIFSDFAKLSGVQFYSLQKGTATEQIREKAGFPIIDLGQELSDFADTAAVLTNLDLLISVDTAVVHLAGALGKPVWVLLGKNHDWRWLQNHLDTVWYSQMRLFRETDTGDKRDSVYQMIDELLISGMLQKKGGFFYGEKN